MARPSIVNILLVDLDAFPAEALEDYLNFLESKEERLTAIEEHLNAAEAKGLTAVVDYFKEFKTT